MILNRIRICILIFLAAAVNTYCGGTDMWDKAGEVGVPCYSVTYNANNATTGTVPVDSAYYKTGETVTVLANTGSLGRTGITFDGWNTRSDGTGTTYAANNTLLMKTENVILYARWICTVTYNSNGATGGTVPAAVTRNYGISVTAADNTGNLVNIPEAGTAEAFKFGGWNTKADGSGDLYESGSTAALTQNTTLYVYWVKFELRDTGPAGGLIFYDNGSFSSGWRYLEAAPEDQSIEPIWGCAGTLITISSADSSAVGAGSQNTVDIETGCETTDTAADICANFSSGGYDDWFLPSTGELQPLYTNLYLMSVGGFTAGTYWSSSQSDADYGWAFNFNDNTSVLKIKSEAAYVRPVRAF